jgi:hypothetical protein
MRTVIEPRTKRDQFIAEQVYGYLRRARELLEKGEASIIEASAYLNLADRYIVWLYPRDCLRPETEKVLARLEHFKPIGWVRFKSEIMNCHAVNGESIDESDLDPRKAALDQAIAAVNEAIVEERISTHLQIRCLGHLMFAGLCLLAALCLASPLALNGSAMKGLPNGPSWIHTFGVDSFGAAIVVGLMGGLGGFLSALMDARRLKMTIDIYQERLLLLEIKPLVGALVSLILFCLLSWGVIPAISPQNFGSYLLVAFVAGFSEKYFLRLLPLDPNEAKSPKASARDKSGAEATANHPRPGREATPD